ncbi:hypothetical protein FB561_5558 [Kribbella amoyensis]|uniref:Secreted protein n=1 Tax=Kribbella amoyensis TaxID=996641 RepID=A0A561BZS6_9ACTN|nr:hypothetical protein [Kribbella amoyensis]TWD84371.1 hypothetical protein FB561_5558 [Kribbella amoyensis]
MRNRLSRGLIALSTVLALLVVWPVAPASADTKHFNEGVCNMYVNSNGFGAYCSGGWIGADLASWRELLGNRPFVPCRDFEVPPGVTLPAPPEGKDWVLRLTIVDYDLGTDAPPGGANAHIERAIVPVDREDRAQCPTLGYMDRFWTTFEQGYPPPVLQVNPTYTPRVNVPAYFDLTPDSAYVLKESNIALFRAGGDNLTMRGVVGHITVDPGDGSKPVECISGVAPIGKDSYDKTKDPFHQLSTCSHVYKRSSANQPDGMYTVKLKIRWDVSYWRTATGDWVQLGSAEVEAVQRLPVQEVQAIGG